jgi:LDH2 family malate/lactate/ureidoglycolate dehydrogenase
VTGDAALLPMGGLGEMFGGHKGYGWSTMVEILCAALQDGAYLKGLLGVDEVGKKGPFKLGHFFMAIDVEHFLPLEVFKKIAGNIVRTLRNSKKAPNCDRIYTAGEKEYEIEKARLKHGIAVNKNLQKDLLKVRDELNLSQYKFSF